MENFLRSGIPLDTEPCLKQKAQETGVCFDSFIQSLKTNKTDLEMASELGVSNTAISHLRDHFERHGLGSSLGND